MATLIITYCVIKACVIAWRDPELMPEDMCWTIAAAIERARPGVAGHCIPTTPVGDRPAGIQLREVFHG